MHTFSSVPAPNHGAHSSVVNRTPGLPKGGQCAFFLAEQGTPGHIVEHGPTDKIFNEPIDPRTADYVNGRFG
ncbi:hypothetical protein ACIA5D_23410 [Actinoplanes sp. NPDC051513]|uniref:hypothetical protein n=1 Tax=Actinoplanes sp. NPDC051513 TaxID=3363908 RepID=UPI0037A3987F